VLQQEIDLPAVLDMKWFGPLPSIFPHSLVPRCNLSAAVHPRLAVADSEGRVCIFAYRDNVLLFASNTAIF
jgi:hypothetical protein